MATTPAPPARRRKPPRAPFLDDQLARVTQAPGLALVPEQAAAADTAAPAPAATPPATTPAPGQTPPREPRPARRAREAVVFSGEQYNVQINAPTVLHKRYKRLAHALKRDGVKVQQREWIAALLFDGPQSPSELRELVETTLDQVEETYQHDQRKSVVNGLVPMELYQAYDNWIVDLDLDENFKTSMTKTVVCLMHDGPQTAAQLLDLVTRYRQATG